MLAITLTEPWATLVAFGKKHIETRSWSTDHRGPIAIHAAKGFPTWARELCFDEPFFSTLQEIGYDPEPYRHNLKGLAALFPLGQIVAVAHIAGCRYTGVSEENQRQLLALPVPPGHHPLLPAEPERSFGDYSPRRYMWYLTSVKRVDPPIPARGALGLWETDVDA